MYLTLIFFLIFLLPIPMLINMLGKREAPFRAVLKGALTACGGAAVIMILASVTGQSVFSEMQSGIGQLARELADSASLAEAMGTQKQSAAERMDFFIEYYKKAAELLPASIGILASLVSYAEYIIFSKLYRPKGIAAIPMTPLKEFNLPRTAAIGWLLMCALAWIITVTEIFPNDIFYNNINMLFDFIFCLQGISVLFYFVYQRGAPRIIAAILTLFFMVAAFGKQVLFILGLLDLIFDLKKKA